MLQFLKNTKRQKSPKKNQGAISKRTLKKETKKFIREYGELIKQLSHE